MSIVSLLIVLLVAVLVIYVIFYIIDAAGIPSPANWIAKAIIAIVAVLIILQRSGYAGSLLG